MRPQFGSSPASAVLTSGEFPIALPMIRAEASLAAPSTVIETGTACQPRPR